MSFDSLFKEYPDEKKMNSLLTLITLISAIFTFGLFVILPEQRTMLSIYVFMMTFAIFGNYIDTLADINKMKNYLSASIYSGPNNKTFILTLIAGLFIGLVIVGNGLAIGLPFTVTSSSSVLELIVVGFLAPLWETYFFVGVVAPTIFLLLKQIIKKGVGIVGLCFTAGSFSLFHYLAYGSSFEAMFGAFIFMFISVLATYVFKSNGLALGWHFGNNIGILLRLI